MNILVVFYSRTDTTKKAAGKISEKLNASLEELVDKKDRGGVVGWIMSGRDAVKKTLADIEDCEKKTENYDLVVIGTPVWVGTMSSAVRTFITNNKNKFKKIATFTTQGGDKDQRVFGDIKELAGIDPVAELKLTTKEVKNDDFETKVDEFVQKIA